MIKNFAVVKNVVIKRFTVTMFPISRLLLIYPMLGTRMHFNDPIRSVLKFVSHIG